jgi:peptide/nickel transport system permease protein
MKPIGTTLDAPREPLAGRRRRISGFAAPKPHLFAAVLIGLICTLSLLAPLMTPYERDAIDLDEIFSPPSYRHVLGTDELGRDVLTRLIHGGRFTLLAAMCSVAVAVLIGTLSGALAGYFGGKADALVTTAVDCFLSIPAFLLLLAAAAVGGGRFWIIPLIIGATSWMETARIVRAKVRSLKEEEFAAAARSIGAHDGAIVFRHILPHAAAPVFVAGTVGFAQAMLIESGLSFLGFGVHPPVPTWGNMLENAWEFLHRAPVGAFAPGFMIFITCLSLNLLADAMRRRLAPPE